jgi:hypothetical protein
VLQCLACFCGDIIRSASRTTAAYVAALASELVHPAQQSLLDSKSEPSCQVALRLGVKWTHETARSLKTIEHTPNAPKKRSKSFSEILDSRYDLVPTHSQYRAQSSSSWQQVIRRPHHLAVSRYSTSPRGVCKALERQLVRSNADLTHRLTPPRESQAVGT